MRVFTQARGDIAVLHVTGRFTAANAAKIIDTVLQSLGSGSRRTSIVDLSRVRSIDDAALTVLIGGYRGVRVLGGEMRLAGLDRGLADAATGARLATTFNVFGSVDEAIAGSIALGDTPTPVPKEQDIEQPVTGLFARLAALTQSS